MTPIDPEDGRKNEGRAPATPPPIPEKWSKPDPVFDDAQRQEARKRSPWGIFLKVIGILVIGTLVLIGLLLGTCFLLVAVHR